MNKIEITVLSARVLDALSGRGLKAKTVHEFERYGTRRIVKHCLGKGDRRHQIRGTGTTSKRTAKNPAWKQKGRIKSTRKRQRE